MKALLTALLAILVLAGCAAQGSVVKYDKVNAEGEAHLYIESDSEIAGLRIVRNAETGELEIVLGPVENRSNALEAAAAQTILALPQILRPVP